MPTGATPALSLSPGRAGHSRRTRAPRARADRRLAGAGRREVAQLLSIDPADDEARTAAAPRSTPWAVTSRPDRPPAAGCCRRRSRICRTAPRTAARSPRSLSDLRIEVEKLDPSGLDTDAGLVQPVGRQDPRRRHPAQAVLHALRELPDPDRLDRAVVGEGPRPAQARQRHARRRPEADARADPCVDRPGRARPGARRGRRRQARHRDRPRRPAPPVRGGGHPLRARQRTLDLQQQLAVNQQGVLAIEIIIRNNRELSAVSTAPST